MDALPGAQRLGHQLAILLASEIVSERMPAGTAFPSVDEVVSRFRVSRTVARETVQTLAMLGLVRVQHGKRTEVCPPEEWDILSAVVQEALRREGKAEPLLRDLYEFRLLIEPQAAAWMAEHGSAADGERLGELADTMLRLAETDGPIADLMEADRSFHDLIARASENRVVAAVSRDIRELIGTLWGFSTLGPGEAKQAAEQHRTIAAAVARRDADGAARAMREHLMWAADADLHGTGESSGVRIPTEPE
jgi:DNA-binding FadR family transcriptional regulator